MERKEKITMLMHRVQHEQPETGHTIHHHPETKMWRFRKMEMFMHTTHHEQPDVRLTLYQHPAMMLCVHHMLRGLILLHSGTAYRSKGLVAFLGDVLVSNCCYPEDCKKQINPQSVHTERHSALGHLQIHNYPFPRFNPQHSYCD
eukprot:1149865-Pelagomonas_calceolata.AAC.4